MVHICGIEVQFDILVKGNNQLLGGLSIPVIEFPTPHPTNDLDLHGIGRYFPHRGETGPAVIEHHQYDDQWKDGPGNFQFGVVGELHWMLVTFSGKMN